MEKDGVTGEGLTFSTKEKEAVSQNIVHYNNIVGTMTGSQIQQGTNNSLQTLAFNDRKQELPEIIAALKDIIEKNLVPQSQDEIADHVDRIEKELQSSAPREKSVIGRLISLQGILENTIGNLAAALTQNPATYQAIILAYQKLSDFLRHF